MPRSLSSDVVCEKLLRDVLEDSGVRKRLEREGLLVNGAAPFGIASIAGFPEVAAALLARVDTTLSRVVPAPLLQRLPMCSLAADAAELWGYDVADAELNVDIVQHIVRALLVFCEDPQARAELHECDVALSVVYAAARSGPALVGAGA